LSLFGELLIEILLDIILGLFPLLRKLPLNLLSLLLGLFPRLLGLLLDVLPTRRLLALLLALVCGVIHTIQAPLRRPLVFGVFGHLRGRLSHFRGLFGGFGGDVGKDIAEEDVCVREEFSEFRVGVD
jgi:hypothetical protein